MSWTVRWDRRYSETAYYSGSGRIEYDDEEILDALGIDDDDYVLTEADVERFAQDIIDRDRSPEIDCECRDSEYDDDSEEVTFEVMAEARRARPRAAPTSRTPHPLTAGVRPLSLRHGAGCLCRLCSELVPLLAAERPTAEPAPAQDTFLWRAPGENP